MYLLLALLGVAALAGATIFAFRPDSPLAKVKVPLVVVSVATLVVGGGGLAYTVLVDEASGVCITPDGVCRHQSRKHCGARWEPTDDFYTAETTCRDAGYSRCDPMSHECRAAP